jgi:hypothetical protein
VVAFVDETLYIISMNAAHLHLLLNHIPVVGTGLVLALITVAIVRRSDELLRICLGVLVALAVLTVPVYLTGEPAEEIVEHQPGVSESALEAHEEAGELAAIAMWVVGVTALVGLTIVRHALQVPPWFGVASLLACLLVAVLLGRAAFLGGKIQHAEIRSSDATRPLGDER